MHSIQVDSIYIIMLTSIFSLMLSNNIPFFSSSLPLWVVRFFVRILTLNGKKTWFFRSLARFFHLYLSLPYFSLAPILLYRSFFHISKWLIKKFTIPITAYTSTRSYFCLYQVLYAWDILICLIPRVIDGMYYVKCKFFSINMTQKNIGCTFKRMMQRYSFSYWQLMAWLKVYAVTESTINFYQI